MNRRLTLVLSIVIMVALIMSFNYSVNAMDPSIYISVDKTAGDVGDIITASVNVKDFERLGGVDVSIKYDKEILQPIKENGVPYTSNTNPEPGDIFIKNEYIPCLNSQHSLDKGFLHFLRFYFNITDYRSNNISEGTGTIAKIYFKILKEEYTKLEFASDETYGNYISGTCIVDWGQDYSAGYDEGPQQITGYSIEGAIIDFGQLPPVSPTPIAINIGDYVVMGRYYDEPILWRCVDIDENGPLMLSDKIISIKPYDAGGNNTANDSSHGRTLDNGQYRKLWGSDFWEDSNMRSWLNSTASAGNVEWLCGNPPTADKIWDGHNAYANEKGFLADGNFTVSERSIIKTVTQKSLLNGYEYSSTRNANYHICNSGISSVVRNYATAYSSQVTDKMFLLDVKQVSRVYENRVTLGDAYYVGQPTQEAVDNSNWKHSSLGTGKNLHYWLRSPYAGGVSGDDVRSVYSDGTVIYYSASDYSVGVRPAFYINLSSVIVTSGSGSETEPYSLAEEVEPYTINEITTEAGIVNINITNNNSASGLLCVASYKDNKLMDIEFKQINIAQGQTDTITSNISVPSGGTSKAFIWDSLNSKQPLSFVKIR